MCTAVDNSAPDAAFGRDRRLLNAADYSRVFDGAEARASHRNLLFLARRGECPHHRLGLVIAKKNVRMAVQRNRIKRIAREIFRQLPDDEITLDVVLLARRGIDQLDNQELSTILRQQWQKLLRHACNPQPNPSRKT